MLWDTFPKHPEYPQPKFIAKPKVNVIDEVWQREKCAMLGLTFHSITKQPCQLIDQPLSDYQPWENEPIIGDGNCLFRCLSQMITGGQNSYGELRTIIASFIASEGTTQLGWYLKQSGYTPLKYYINEKMTQLDGAWAGDIEIMAASEILNADIRRK